MMPSNRASCSRCMLPDTASISSAGCLASLVDIQQVGVGQVSGMPGRAQGRLQGLGTELPPVAGIDIARLQPGGRAGLVAKLVLLARSRA